MAEVKEQSTKVVTGKCRLSYAHLFEPHINGRWWSEILFLRLAYSKVG
jgi:hypothetical protein